MLMECFQFIFQNLKNHFTKKWKHLFFFKNWKNFWKRYNFPKFGKKQMNEAFILQMVTYKQNAKLRWIQIHVP